MNPNYTHSMRPLNLLPEDFTIRTKEMDTHTTYLLCPDHTCDLYFDTSRWCPCESECPQQGALIKMIRCLCGKVLELPGTHDMLRRVDHEHSDGSRASNFQRMSGRYHLLYEKPQT